MNKLTLLLVFSSTFVYGQSFTIDPSNQSNIIKAESANQGVLVTKMSSVQKNQIPVLQRVEGMMVYDTDAHQFSYWTGSVWVNFGNATPPPAGWGLTGNADTDPATNFIGTTDNKPLNFRQNNQWLGSWNATTKNYFLGKDAGKNNNGTNNIVIGDNAFSSLTSTSLAMNSVALGSNALKSNIAGSANIGIGTDALFNNQNGNFSIAIGKGALAGPIAVDNTIAIGNGAMQNAGTLANYSVAIGPDALKNYSNTAGQNGNNTAIGAASMQNAVSGYNNTSLGYFALHDNVVGQSNTALGTNSMRLYLGNYNVAVGAEALNNSGAGNGNVSVGYQAITGNTGNYAVGIGYQAALNSNSDKSIAIGYQAGFSNKRNQIIAIGDEALLYNSNTSNDPTEGKENTAVGSAALNKNQKGSSNTGIGFNVLYNNGNGNQNTALGVKSLYNNFSGNQNTAIGYNTNIPNTYASSLINNATAIGANAQADISDAVILGAVGGKNGVSPTAPSVKVGIGTTTPGALLHVKGDNISIPTAFFDGVSPKVGIGISSPLVALHVNGNGIFEGINPKVGIGTTTPQEALDVKGNGIFNGINPKVGIGTLSPQATLDVNGNSRVSSNLGIGTIASGKAPLEINRGGSSDASNAIFGSGQMGISLQQNAPAVGFNQYRDNADGNQSKFMGTGHAVLNYLDPLTGYLKWNYLGTGSANSLTPAVTTSLLTIAPNGNVGIGRLEPESKLDVNGSIKATGLELSGPIQASSLQLSNSKLTMPATGNANLLPYAWGRIDADGNIIQSTGNFTVIHNTVDGDVYLIDFGPAHSVKEMVMVVTPFSNYANLGRHADVWHQRPAEGIPTRMYITIREDNGDRIAGEFNFIAYEY